MNETGKEKAELLQTRVGIDFHVEGEARFLSHHDMMRCMEHAVGRGRAPVAFSAGFNPRPKLSAPLPRPVGVASRAELLVIRLTQPVDVDALCERLAAQMPEGVTITGCRLLENVRTMHAAAASYEAPLTEADAEELAGRIADLRSSPSWPYHRAGRADGGKGRDLELRDLIAAVDVEQGTLRFTLAPVDDVWARIPEVLDLLNVDSPQMRCRVVRTGVRWVAHQPKPQLFELTEDTCPKKC